MFRSFPYPYLILAFCASPFLIAQNLQPPVRIRATEIIFKPETRILSFSAPLKARSRAALGFGVSGRLTQRWVKTGDRVSMGQPLAQMDDRTYQNGVTAAKGEVSRLGAQKEQAGKELDRVRSLFENRAATQEEMEALETSYEGLCSALQSAVARSDEAEHLLEETELKAPFNATIAECLIEEGEFAGPAQPVFLLAGEELEVEIRIPESQLPLIKIGQEVEVGFPLTQISSVKGIIHQISRANARPNRLFPVLVHIPKHEGLGSGITAEVRLIMAEEDTLQVPVSAIINPGGKQPKVITVEDGTVDIVPVEIIRISGTMVSIRAEIKPGVKVALTGHSGLIKGDRVEVLP